jgi:hypothetical protein
VAQRFDHAPARFEVQLDPPSLGPLEVRLVVNGESVQLSLVADRPEARDLLASGLGELSAALAEQGLSLTGADVSAREGHARHRFDDSRDPILSADPEPVDPAPPATPTHAGSLDVRV